MPGQLFLDFLALVVCHSVALLVLSNMTHKFSLPIVQAPQHHPLSYRWYRRWRKFPKYEKDRSTDRKVLGICLTVCTPIHLSTCYQFAYFITSSRPISLPILRPVYLSTYPSIYIASYLFCLSIYLICLSACLPFYPIDHSTYLSIYLSIYPSIYLSIYLSNKQTS